MVIKVWQLAAALVLLVVGAPSTIYVIGHGHGLALFVFVSVSATVWLGLDARKRDWSESRSRWGARNTTTWVIASLLLWIVVFPIYLTQRGRVPLKDDIDDISPSPREVSVPPEISSDSTAEPGVAPGLRTAFWPAAVCVGGMALGAIGHWARGPLGTTVSGLDGPDGWVLLGAAAIAGLSLCLHHMSARRGWLTLLLLVGLAGAGVTFYDRRSLSSATGDSSDVAQVGWGLHLGLVSSVGLVIFALALFARTGSRRTATSDTDEAWPEAILVPPAPVRVATPSEAASQIHEPEQSLPPVAQKAPIQRPVVYGGMTADLERLAVLYASGALDEEEFRAAKARLLQAPAIATAATREALIRTRGPYQG